MSNPERRRDRLIVTCEHAGNVVPERHAALFVGHEDLLQTHRGWDPGALTLAREFAATYDAELLFDETTRLLVDLNRSVGTPELHVGPSQGLPPKVRREILETHYHPHRQRVARAFADAIGGSDDRLVHIASHSFTPELNGHVRTADIGLLYDPRRPGETAFATAWIGALRQADPAYRLRRNYPYLGASDGVCQSMRRLYPPDRYVGIELEVNQRYVEAGGEPWEKIRRDLVATLGAILAR